MKNIGSQSWGPSLRKITVKVPMVRAFTVGCAMTAVLTTHTGGSPDVAMAIINPPKSAAASGLLDGMLEGQDEDGDGDDDDEATGVDVKANDGKRIRRERERELTAKNAKARRRRESATRKGTRKHQLYSKRLPQGFHWLLCLTSSPIRKVRPWTISSKMTTSNALQLKSFAI